MGIAVHNTVDGIFFNLEFIYSIFMFILKKMT